MTLPLKGPAEGKRKGYCFYTYDVNLLFWRRFFHHTGDPVALSEDGMYVSV